jgi:hypothetical protein
MSNATVVFLQPLENIMSVAIRTRMVDGRIVAICNKGSASVQWCDKMEEWQNHAKACQHLQLEIGWNGLMVGGVFEDAYYWVLAGTYVTNRG